MGCRESEVSTEGTEAELDSNEAQATRAAERRINRAGQGGLRTLRVESANRRDLA